MDFYRTIRKRYIYLLFVVLGILFCLLRLPNLTALPAHYDEPTYISWSQSAWFGDMSAQMKNGKPPLHSLSMMPFLKVFSDPLNAARMLSVLCGALTLIVIVLIGREILDLLMGVCAGILWVVCPYNTSIERIGLAESMLVMFFLFAVYFALRAVMKEDYRYLLGAGIFTGLALLTKQTAQLLYLVLPCAYLARGPRQKEMEKKKPLLRWLITIVPALLIGYGISCLLRFSSLYRNQSVRVTIVTKTLPEIIHNPFDLFPGNLKSILQNWWSTITPVLLIICFIGICFGLIRRWRPAYFLLCWFLIAFLISTMIAKFQFPRNWNVALPPLILGAAYAVRILPKYIYQRIKKISRINLRRTLVAVSVILSVAILSAVVIPVTKADLSLVYPSSQELRKYGGELAYREVVDEINRLSRSKKLDVWAYNQYTRMLLKIYLRENMNVSTKYFGNNLQNIPPKVLQSKVATGVDTYVASFSLGGIPNRFSLEDIKRFPGNGKKGAVIVFAKIAKPWINSIKPYKGRAGTKITITGCNFGQERGASSVSFKDVYASEYLKWTDDVIVTVVPPVTAGIVGIIVHTKKGVSYHHNFIAQ